MTFKVDYVLLERTGAKATELANDAGKSLQQMRVSDVPGALSGSWSADAARRLDEVWAKQAPELASKLSEYGTKLSESAAAYRQVEEDAEKMIEAEFKELQ